LPSNYITFTSNEQGLGENENSLVVKLKLTRQTDKDVPVTVNFTTQNLTYGTDFITAPAAVSGAINVIVPSGNNEASFTVSKAPGALFDGDEKLQFTINRSEAPILIGASKQFGLEFKELVATTSTLQINGGGATFPNRVFVDLSANRQTAVLRTNWDLGFYSDAADFKVILNSSVGVMAKKLAKSDLTQVTAADTTGLLEAVAYSSFAPDVLQMPYVDYPNGDLTRTAFGLIEPTAADNKVFIVNRGTGVGTSGVARGWKKVRIFRNGSGGYTIQHADIAATTFTTVEIPKNSAYFFNYFSFDNGSVSVEPEKTKWDISWSYFGYVTNFGTGEVPYLFQDIVSQNRNVQILKVLAATKAYADFSAANLTDGTVAAGPWAYNQLTIGSDWRRTTPSPAQTYSDRYYIVKDGNNNYYKLRFIELTDAGVRGFPKIEFALVKRG